MSSYYITPVECYAIDTLHCSKEDLELLNYVYSELTDYLKINTRELIKSEDLHSIMYNLYQEVSEKIGDEVYCISGYQTVSNKEGIEMVDFTVTDNISRQLKEVSNELKNCKPEYDSKDGRWYFNNFLDEVIDDWDMVELLQQDILQYLYDNDILVISEADLCED